jgi:hypothetical protein
MLDLSDKIQSTTSHWNVSTCLVKCEAFRTCLLNIIELQPSEIFRWDIPVVLSEIKRIRGVFKKRLNFLNSVPTSTDSTLQLLSAPSVRFWQQTAICPVALWALDVELHLLNWARDQAVCRISDKLTTKELEECVCVCVCGHEGWP